MCKVGKVCKVEKVRSTFHTFHDYLNFYGEKKDDRLFTIYDRTLPSKEIFPKLVNSSKDENILWTSAEEVRVFAILEYYKITEKFKKILFSKKTDVEKDVGEICKLFKCSQEDLIFFEDNFNVIYELVRLKLKYNPIL